MERASEFNKKDCFFVLWFKIFIVHLAPKRPPNRINLSMNYSGTRSAALLAFCDTYLSYAMTHAVTKLIDSIYIPSTKQITYERLDSNDSLGIDIFWLGVLELDRYVWWREWWCWSTGLLANSWRWGIVWKWTWLKLKKFNPFDFVDLLIIKSNIHV